MSTLTWWKEPMRSIEMHIMAEVDMNRLIEEIEEDVIDIAALATDAEITRQFETIQKELEGILKSYIKDVIEGKL